MPDAPLPHSDPRLPDADASLMRKSRISRSWDRIHSVPGYLWAIAGTALTALVLLSGVTFGFTTAHAVISLAILAVALLLTLLSDAVTFFLTFSLVAAILPMVASNVYIEFGNYISEQGVDGTASGATTRLVVYCLLYLGATFAIVSVATRRLARPFGTPRTAMFVKWAYGVHALALVGGIGILAFGGVPLLRGQDRFAFWAELPGVLNRFPYLIAMLCFVTVVAAVIGPRGRSLWAPITLFFISIVELVLLSEKFTGLFAIFTLSIIGAYVSIIQLRGARVRVGRLIAICTVVVGLLLILACVGFILFYGYTIDTVFGKLVDRVFGLQGHVWFGVDRVMLSGSAGGNWIDLFPPYRYDGLTGMEVLMYQISHPDFVDRMLAKGARFTMAGQALPVFVLGYGWALVYQVVGGALTGLVLCYLLRSILRLNLPSILIALLGLRQITNVFIVGDTADLYKPLTLLFLVWVIADLALSRIPAAAAWTQRTLTVIDKPAAASRSRIDKLG